MAYPTELATRPYFLTAADNLGERANQSLAVLQAHGFVAGVGLTEQFVPDVAGISAEQAVADYCPNDKGRLGTVADARVWQAKGRGHMAIYANPLLDADTSSLSQADLQDMAQAGYLQVVAHGWSGHKRNEHIDGANITTAYRVGALGTQLARERSSEGERLRMGLHLGELVLGTTVHVFGADPRQISEEHWKSNDRARRLYADLGFNEVVVEEPEMRPTNQPLGTVVDGGTVTVGLDKNRKLIRVVEDRRIHAVLRDHPLITAA